jgi:hypothetical protein
MVILIEIELLKWSSDFINDLDIRKRFASISKDSIYANDVIFEDTNPIIIWNPCQYPVKYGRIYQWILSLISRHYYLKEKYTIQF